MGSGIRAKSGMNVRRLFMMGITELANRGRQGTSKWVERVALARRRNGHVQAISEQLASQKPLSEIQEQVRQGDLDGAARILLDRFQEASPGRFFEGAVDGETSRLLAMRCPAALDQMLATAETTCQKRFDLLGFRQLSFDDPVDWHLDPVAGQRAPLVYWGRLDPLDPARVGDSKVIWELNRHQWLVQLGQAYRVTKDERYAETFAVSVREWLHANPRGLGINWASSLEVSLRLIAWCWTLLLFRGSRALTSELFVRMLSGISAHASHIEKYLSHYFSPNTHLTGEALGLFYAGILFPELRGAERWCRLGTRILLEQSKRQVLPDGVHFEQSTCYQRYTVEIYLHFLSLASRNGIEVPTSIGERVQRMLDFLLAVRRPDGTIPLIGDADGGWLLPLLRRSPDDFRGIFSTAAAFFGRSDYCWAAGDVAPETLWLLGPTGLKAFEALPPAPPEISPSRLFQDGGYVVMSGGWSADAHQLIFDVGPLGCPVSAGHGHADLLSVQCSVFGQPFIVDPGMYCYTPDRDWRDFFRGTAAHSAAIVDGEPQAIPAGPFRWNSRPQARLHRWTSTGTYDFADASHDAYSRLPDPVIHRRRVLFVKSRYWVFVDDIEGEAEHHLDLCFQFAPVEVTLEPTLWARVRGSAGRGLFIRPFAAVPLQGEVHEAAVAPLRGWIAPDYGQRRPAPALTYSAETRLPLRILTLLVPTKDISGSLPTVTVIEADAAGPVGLRFEETHEIVRFNDDWPVVEEQKQPCVAL
jgi:hypothetical protein